MRLRIFLTLGIPLLLLMNAYGQSGNNRINTEKLTGYWKAADSTTFRGKEIEFLPDNQVRLILANGGEQPGQYEVSGNVITFSIGDALPFNVNFRLEGGNLYLVFPDDKDETQYIKQND